MCIVDRAPRERIDEVVGAVAAVGLRPAARLGGHSAGPVGAGCSAPVGALAEVAEGDLGDELWIRAVAMSFDGALSVRRSASGT